MRSFEKTRAKLTAALAALTLAGSALGQAPPPGSAPPSGPKTAELTPPELLGFVEAVYPSQAERERREADVALMLEIDAEGKVTHASVVEPVGYGFDEAALAAAQRFEFRAARRAGVAIASKILYRYSFRLKKVAVEAPAPASSLRVRVVVAGSDAPIVGARVEVRRDGRALSSSVTGADGRFALAELPPGRYQVTFAADGFEPHGETQQLDASEEVEVTVGLVARAAEGEIVVRGARPTREVTRRTVSRRELSLIPGTSGDALRAVQNLPGVARPPSLSGLLVVRGNPDQSTPVFVDGMWLASVYHFGGLSSVVPTEMLDEVNFYPGNFSVRYGRALGGVVDATFRQTRDDGRYHGFAQLDMIDARVFAEGPLPGVEGWNFIGAARRSHVDAWLAPALEGQDTHISAAPVYYDYQLIVDRRFTPKSYLRLGLLGYDDRFRVLDETNAQGGQFDALNATLGLGSIFEAELDAKTRLRLNASGARSHQRFGVGAVNIDIVAWGFESRAEIEHRVLPRATFRAGLDLLFAPYSFTGRLPEDLGANAPDVGSIVTAPGQIIDRTGTFFAPALFAELDMRPNSRTQVVSGVRYDFTLETGRHDVAPRLVARYDLIPEFPKTTLKGGTGLFFQAPGLVELALNDEQAELLTQRSFQNSLGVEQDLSRQLRLSVEGFYNLLDGLTTRSPGPDGSLAYNSHGTGRIFGVEGMLRYEPDEHFFGWISYTLSRSERTWVPGGPSTLFYLDQTHILTALGSYELGKGWTAGVRFRYTTGNLYTPCLGGLFSSTGANYVCVSGPTNSQRLPSFNQLDVRIDKRFQFKDFSLSVYLDLINAYNRENADIPAYNFDYSAFRPQTASLPIVPSLGIRGEF